MEFTTPQAATATKHMIENLGQGRKHMVNYTNPHTNPFRTLPKDAPMRKEGNRPGGFSPGGGNMNFGMNNMGGGFRGRGGYNNRGGMNNFNNRNNFTPMGGFQGAAGPAGGMMGGFQGGPMGGMQNYGFNNRGGMMGGMRGGPGGMRGGRGGNMGAGNMMGMPGMNPMGAMGMNPMAGGMNPMMGGMGGNMGMQGKFQVNTASNYLIALLDLYFAWCPLQLTEYRPRIPRSQSRLQSKLLQQPSWRWW